MLDLLLTRAILPTGFALLVYSLAIDHFHNPVLFSGAITILTTVGMRAATRNGSK